MWRTELTFGTDLPVKIEKAAARLTLSLHRVGFVAQVYNLDTERFERHGNFRRCKLLTLFDPHTAARVSADDSDELGLLLPCHVLIYETLGNITRIVVMDPVKQAGVSCNPRLLALAQVIHVRVAKCLLDLSRSIYFDLPEESLIGRQPEVRSTPCKSAPNPKSSHCEAFRQSNLVR